MKLDHAKIVAAFKRLGERTQTFIEQIQALGLELSGGKIAKLADLKAFKTFCDNIDMVLGERLPQDDRGVLNLLRVFFPIKEENFFFLEAATFDYSLDYLLDLFQILSTCFEDEKNNFIHVLYDGIANSYRIHCEVNFLRAEIGKEHPELTKKLLRSEESALPIDAFDKLSYMNDDEAALLLKSHDSFYCEWFARLLRITMAVSEDGVNLQQRYQKFLLEYCGDSSCYQLESLRSLLSQPSVNLLSGYEEEISTLAAKVRDACKHARRLWRPPSPSSFSLGAQNQSEASGSGQEEVGEDQRDVPTQGL